MEASETIMGASERIEALAHYSHCSVRTLSEKCGYDRPQAFYDVQRGRTKNISASMCEKILMALPEVNRVWLMTGEGEMLLSAAQSNEVPEPKVRMVPLVPLSAFAGPIKTYYENGVELSRCEMIPSPSPQAELALTITGDSMEPVFANGSIAYVRRINEQAFIPWGHPMVLDTENGVFIKNVLPDSSNEKYVWGESVNPKYPKMHIPKTSIYGLYRVLMVIKSFMTM